MLLWNAKYVRPPPISSVLMSRGDLNIDKLELVCNQAVSVLSNQKQLHMEAALLSRVLYRMKSKFHQNIGFKHMEKVNRGLLQYLSLDLFGVYSTFTALVPKVPRDPQVYLPTRQMLQWVLVRTQGFARLFCFIVQKCQDAAPHFRLLLTLGHTWENAMLVMGLAARIWCMAKYLASSACDWYSQLKPFLETLKCTGRNWLPIGYEFPDDLVKWLDAPWLTESKKLKSVGVDKVLSRLMSTADGEEKEDLNDIIKLVSKKGDVNGESEVDGIEQDESVSIAPSDARSADVKTQKEMSVEPLSSKEDIGEIISRKFLKKMAAKQRREAGSEPVTKKQKTEFAMNISCLKQPKAIELSPHVKKKAVQLIGNGVTEKGTEDGEEAVEEQEIQNGKEFGRGKDVPVILQGKRKDDTVSIVEEEEEDNSNVLLVQKDVGIESGEEEEEEDEDEDPNTQLLSLSSKKSKMLLAKTSKKHQVSEESCVPTKKCSENNPSQLEDKSEKKKQPSGVLIPGNQFKSNRLQDSEIRTDEANASTKVKHKTDKSKDLSHFQVLEEGSEIRSGEASLLNPESKKQLIKSLRTSKDIEKFLSRESDLRDKCSDSCLTRELDKLQWNMFYNAVSEYIKKLNKKSVQNDKDQYEILMKKARKAIKLRIL